MKDQIRLILLPLLKANKRGFFVIFLLSMMVSIGGAVQPYIMQNIIDHALIKQDTDLLYLLVGLSFVLAIIMMLIKSVNEIFYTKFSMNILFSFREKVFEKLFSYKKSFLNSFHSADLMTRLQGDVNELQRFFTDSILALFSTFISLIIITSIIYSYNITLMLLILVFLPIEFLCIRPLYSHMHTSTKEMRERTAQTSQFFVETLRHFTFFKLQGAKRFAMEKLNQTQESYKTTVIHNKKVNIVFTQIPALISLLGKSIILSYGGYLTIQGELSIGELIAFLTFFAMILSPVHTLLGIVNNIPKVKVSMERLIQILPPEEPSMHLDETDYTLEVKGVSFAHHNLSIFDTIDLKVPKNEKIALIGKNGKGKSTLSNLLCGIENPDSGEILIGSTNIANRYVENITDYIVKMEQIPVIFDGTVKDNLCMSRKGITEEEIINALNLTGMGEWYRQLGEGLQSRLSESGNNLSVGQKQRLSLARILLHKPKIVILDEFTSAIDKEDTRWFFDSICALFADTSLIVITHELDMLERFDAVYAIEEKKLMRVHDA